MSTKEEERQQEANDRARVAGGVWKDIKNGTELADGAAERLPDGAEKRLRSG